MNDLMMMNIPQNNSVPVLHQNKNNERMNVKALWKNWNSEPMKMMSKGQISIWDSIKK